MEDQCSITCNENSTCNGTSIGDVSCYCKSGYQGQGNDCYGMYTNNYVYLKYILHISLTISL